MAPKALRFHVTMSPHPLAVLSAKASCNGSMLIPYLNVLGYDEKVWGVQTTIGPKEVNNGDWIVEHPVFGVFVMTNDEFQANFKSN